MQTVNKLGIRVAVITIVVMFALFGVYAGVKQLFFSSSSVKSSQSVLQPVEPLVDSDGDGVPDLIETLYKTDPQNADTDGDGTSDGNELTARRDPTVAGPNDTLSDTIGPYTERYVAQLPTESDQDTVLDPGQLETFVEQERGDLLPELPADIIKTTTEEGADAVRTYLDAISASHNDSVAFIDSADITIALQAQQDDNNVQPLADIVTTLETNLSVFKEVQVPQEVVGLHKKLLSASQALLDNVQLLQHMEDDFVGGLVGAKNIEALGPVFEEIADEIGVLEAKYELE